MTWWLWMLTGAACVVLAVLAFAALATWVESVARRRRRAVSSQRQAAEAQLQRTVEKTITKMFDATRDYYR